mgnify:CR=1 FL=1
MSLAPTAACLLKPAAASTARKRRPSHTQPTSFRSDDFARQSCPQCCHSCCRTRGGAPWRTITGPSILPCEVAPHGLPESSGRAQACFPTDHARNTALASSPQLLSDEKAHPDIPFRHLCGGERERPPSAAARGAWRERRPTRVHDVDPLPPHLCGLPRELCREGNHGTSR